MESGLSDLVLRCWTRLCLAELAKTGQRLATDRTVRGSNRRVEDIFQTHPNRPRGPPILCNGYWFSVTGLKRSGCDAEHHPLLGLDSRVGVAVTPRGRQLSLFQSKAVPPFQVACLPKGSTSVSVVVKGIAVRKFL